VSLIDTIHLRPATAADIPLLRRWDKQPHIRQGVPPGTWHWEAEFSRDPPWRHNLIAMLRERPIGFAQIIEPALEDSHYWGEVEPHLRAVDIWIGDPEQIGQGRGTAIMEQVLARCFAPPEVTGVLLDPLASNTRAHRFYERLGFIRDDHRWFDGDECYVYRLTREDWAASA